eukprot:TCONS_00029720-protein
MASNFTPTKEQNGHDAGKSNVTPVKFTWTSPNSFSFQHEDSPSPSFLKESPSTNEIKTDPKVKTAQSPKGRVKNKARRNLNKPSNDTFFIPTTESRTSNLPSNAVFPITNTTNTTTSANGFTFQGKTIGSSPPYVFGASTNLPYFPGLATEDKNISQDTRTTSTTTSEFKLTPSKFVFSQSPKMNLFNDTNVTSSSNNSTTISSFTSNVESQETCNGTKKKTTVFRSDNLKPGVSTKIKEVPLSSQVANTFNGLLTTVTTTPFSTSSSTNEWATSFISPRSLQTSITTESTTINTTIQITSSGSTTISSSFNAWRPPSSSTSTSTSTTTFKFGTAARFNFGKPASTSTFNFTQPENSPSNQPTFKFGQSSIANSITSITTSVSSSSPEVPKKPTFNFGEHNLTSESATNFWKSPNGTSTFFTDRKSNSSQSKTRKDSQLAYYHSSDCSSDDLCNPDVLTSESSLRGATSSNSNLRGETDVEKLKDGIDQLKALLSELNSVRPLNDMRTIGTMISSLENTVDNVRETFKCEICFVRQYNYFFFCHDCGRLVGCFLCAYKLDRCPTCRKRLPPRKNRSPYVIPGLAGALSEKEITRADLWKEVEKIRL